MANIDAVKTAIAKTEPTVSIHKLIEKSAKELGKALPEHMRPERLVRIGLTCIRLNPDLALCTPASFLGALFTSAQLGIEPIAGRAYILPFNNNKKVNGQWVTVKEAQFMMGYKGLAELFYRHEKSIQLSWGVYREGDDFQYEEGTNAFLRHRPLLDNKGAVKAYYVIASLQNGGKPFKVMGVEECMDHGRKHSKTYDRKTRTFHESSPWATNPEPMCLKTVLIQLMKLLPLSSELQKAIAADETSREYREGIGDAFDIPVNGWDSPIEAETVPEKPATEKPNENGGKQ